MVQACTRHAASAALWPLCQQLKCRAASAMLQARASDCSDRCAGSVASLLSWGALGSAQAGLPITKGPQTKGENGKGGKKGRL